MSQFQMWVRQGAAVLKIIQIRSHMYKMLFFLASVGESDKWNIYAEIIS
jgi:hypothetical protein